MLLGAAAIPVRTRSEMRKRWENVVDIAGSRQYAVILSNGEVGIGVCCPSAVLETGPSDERRFFWS